MKKRGEEEREGEGQEEEDEEDLIHLIRCFVAASTNSAYVVGFGSMALRRARSVGPAGHCNMILGMIIEPRTRGMGGVDFELTDEVECGKDEEEDDARGSSIRFLSCAGCSAGRRSASFPF